MEEPREEREREEGDWVAALIHLATQLLWGLCLISVTSHCVCSDILVALVWLAIYAAVVLPHSIHCKISMWFGCHSGNLKCQFSRCCPSARATHKKCHVELLYLRFFLIWRLVFHLAGSILAPVSVKWHRYELVSWMRFLLFSMLLIPPDSRRRQRTPPSTLLPPPLCPLRVSLCGSLLRGQHATLYAFCVGYVFRKYPILIEYIDEVLKSDWDW